MTEEDGSDLPPAPGGSAWVYAWYCPGCGAELGEPGDPEPPKHGCTSLDPWPAWEWALAPVDWREEECIRASGEVICAQCGKPYWKHAQVAKAEAPTLVRACDGRLLKL